MASEIPSQSPFVTKAPPWHEWVTADLFLLSLGSGTFIVAALCLLLRPDEMGNLARIAFYGIFPVMLADLACLIADLGDPARFHHMLRVLKPKSAMSVGVWTISVFAFVSFLAFAAALLGLPLIVLRTIAAIGLVPALIAGAYKGVLFSTTAQPAWRKMRWLGAAFALSSAAMGAAVILEIASTSGNAGASNLLRFMLMWLLVVNALAVRRIMGRVAMMGHLSDVGDRATILRVSLHYTIFIVAGLGLPIVLCALTKGTSAIDSVIVAIVFAGAALSRHYLVMLPHWISVD